MHDNDIIDRVWRRGLSDKRWCWWCQKEIPISRVTETNHWSAKAHTLFHERPSTGKGEAHEHKVSHLRTGRENTNKKPRQFLNIFSLPDFDNWLHRVINIYDKHAHSPFYDHAMIIRPIRV